MKSMYLMVMLMALMGCAGQDAASALEDQTGPTREDEAQARLFSLDLKGARDVYAARLAQNPADPDAAAGKAVLDVLLLPYSSAMTRVLKDSLGASRGLDATRDVIYGDGGYLYLLSRGVPFADGESFPGIATLLEDDLPWSTREMTSLTDFVAELNQPVSTFWDGMEVVADDLSVVVRNLTTSVEAEAFQSYFLPGEIFHDQSLNLVLGKSELSALRTVVSGVRAATYFLGAYDWNWSLADGFGAQWDVVDVADPAFKADWVYEDYVTAFVADRTLRSVRQSQRLGKAGEAFGDTMNSAAQTLRLGASATSDTVLDWTRADEDLIEELAVFLEAVGASAGGRVALPYTLPSTSMDLSSFFAAPGRVLPAEAVWLEQTVVEDEFGVYTSWEMPDATVEAFLVDGVMDPEFSMDAAPEFQFSGDTVEFGQSISGDFTSDVEGAYLSGR